MDLNQTAGIPKCCVTTNRDISSNMLMKVYKWKVQNGTGACDIDALVLYMKKMLKPICADPKLKEQLFKIRSQMMHHRKQRRFYWAVEWNVTWNVSASIFVQLVFQELVSYISPHGCFFFYWLCKISTLTCENQLLATTLIHRWKATKHIDSVAVLYNLEVRSIFILYD